MIELRRPFSKLAAVLLVLLYILAHLLAKHLELRVWRLSAKSGINIKRDREAGLIVV